MIYTDPVFLRNSPEEAVRLLEDVFEYYPPNDLDGECIWLNQWRESLR